jgi:dUTP diphosphatase
VPGPVDAPRPAPSAPPPAAGDGPPAPPAAADLTVPLTRLDPALPVPGYARDGDAGVDLHAAADVRLAPGERALVGTGVALALPPGHAGFVHPRSGLAARTGLSIVNAPGTVDAGYRGEIRVCLVNLDRHEAVELRRGDRIAQLVVQRVERVRFVEVDELPPSERGAGGHGSTGGHAVLVRAAAAPAPRPEPSPESEPEFLPDPMPGDPMAAPSVPVDLAVEPHPSAGRVP